MPTPEVVSWEPTVLWAALNFSPHPGQRAVLHLVDNALRHVPGSPTFLDICSGRQWGKTTVAEAAVWSALLQPDDEFGPPTVKIMSDHYEHGRVMWDKFTAHLYNSELLKPLVVEYDKARLLITLTTGATVQLLSTDNPQTITGYTLSMAVVDEAAFVDDKAMEHLLPCVAVRNGTVLAFGTAEGAGWHRSWYIMGQDPNYPNHWSTSYPSTSNPYFPKEALENQRLTLPERRFRQLYLAEWQNEEGAVFHNIEGCILHDVGLEAQAYIPGHTYVGGVDFGRHQDWTVVYVGDVRTGRIVLQERFRQTDWMSQVERVAEVSKAYNNPSMVCDATGVGDAVVDMLRERGVNVVPVVFSPSMKEKIISRLVVALEREDIRFPAWPDLVQELKLYESHVLPSGRVTTSAPSTFHDDCVNALALWNHGVWQGYGRGTEEVMAIEQLWDARV